MLLRVDNNLFVRCETLSLANGVNKYLRNVRDVDDLAVLLSLLERFRLEERIDVEELPVTERQLRCSGGSARLLASSEAIRNSPRRKQRFDNENVRPLDEVVVQNLRAAATKTAYALPT